MASETREEEDVSAGPQESVVPGMLIRAQGMGLGEKGWQTQDVKFRIPRGKYLGEVGAPQIASEVHQTRKESMRLFHPYFFYPIL